MCRGERQTLQGKSPKLKRISHTISGKLDELPTDLGTKLLGSIRIKEGLMRIITRVSGYRKDFEGSSLPSTGFRVEIRYAFRQSKTKGVRPSQPADLKSSRVSGFLTLDAFAGTAASFGSGSSRHLTNPYEQLSRRQFFCLPYACWWKQALSRRHSRLCAASRRAKLSSWRRVSFTFEAFLCR